MAAGAIMKAPRSAFLAYLLGPGKYKKIYVTTYTLLYYKTAYNYNNKSGKDLWTPNVTNKKATKNAKLYPDRRERSGDVWHLAVIEHRASYIRVMETLFLIISKTRPE